MREETAKFEVAAASAAAASAADKVTVAERKLTDIDRRIASQKDRPDVSYFEYRIWRELLLISTDIYPLRMLPGLGYPV